MLQPTYPHGVSASTDQPIGTDIDNKKVTNCCLEDVLGVMVLIYSPT